MRRRRRRLPWILALLVLGLGTVWLLSPIDDGPVDGSSVAGTDSTGSSGLGGRASKRTRLEAIVAWVQRAFGHLDLDAPPVTPFEPPPTLGPPGSIDVVVGDGEGRFFEGAWVVVSGPPGVAQIPAGRTGPDGRVRFAELPSGANYVVDALLADASYADPAIRARRVEVRAGAATSVQLEWPVFVVEGVVRDAETGEPVPDATVEGFDLDPVNETRSTNSFAYLSARAFGEPMVVRPVAIGTTARDGTYRIALGTCRNGELRVRTEDGRWGGAPLKRSGPRLVRDVKLLRSEILEGTVVDGEDRALAGIRVSRRPDTANFGDAPEAVTDADGRFHLQLEDWLRRTTGKIRLVLEGPGVPRFAAEVVRDGTARIVVPGRAWLDVRVVERDSDSPIVGAQVLVTVGSVTVVGTTDDSGRAHCPIEAGPIRSVDVSWRGRRIGPGSIASTPEDGPGRPIAVGEVRSFVIRVEGREWLSVRGRVVDAEGRPAPAVGGWIHDALGPDVRVQTNEDGVFRASLRMPRPPGQAPRTLFRFHDAVRGNAFESRNLGEPDAEGWNDVGDFALGRDGVVRFRVVDGEGRPVATARAAWHQDGAADSEGWITCRTTDWWADPAPESLDFRVVAPGFRAQELRCPRIGEQAIHRDLPPIRLERATPVTVRILTFERQPVVGAKVKWSNLEFATATLTGEDGSASLLDELGSDGKLEIYLPDGVVFDWSGRVPSGGAGRVDVYLPRRRDLVVTITGAGGEPLPRAWAHASGKSIGSVWLRNWPGAKADATGVAKIPALVAFPGSLRVGAPDHVTQELAFDATAHEMHVRLNPIDDAARRRRQELRGELAKIDEAMRSEGPEPTDADRARYARRSEVVGEIGRLEGR